MIDRVLESIAKSDFYMESEQSFDGTLPNTVRTFSLLRKSNYNHCENVQKHLQSDYFESTQPTILTLKLFPLVTIYAFGIQWTPYMIVVLSLQPDKIRSIVGYKWNFRTLDYNLGWWWDVSGGADRFCQYTASVLNVKRTDERRRQQQRPKQLCFNATAT